MGNRRGGRRGRCPEIHPIPRNLCVAEFALFDLLVPQHWPRQESHGAARIPSLGAASSHGRQRGSIPRCRVDGARIMRSFERALRADHGLCDASQILEALRADGIGVLLEARECSGSRNRGD